MIKRYIEGISRDQGTLFPDHLDDWIDDENVVRVIDAFVDELDLRNLGFKPAEKTGRPGYHPSLLLKLYIYGYLICPLELSFKTRLWHEIPEASAAQKRE